MHNNGTANCVSLYGVNALLDMVLDSYSVYITLCISKPSPVNTEYIVTHFSLNDEPPQTYLQPSLLCHAHAFVSPIDKCLASKTNLNM